jgi:hypothetical protein
VSLRIAATLVVAGLAMATPAPAAFEWEHPTAWSLISGDSPARWPAAGEGLGLRADAIAGRPWGWPGVGAGAVRIARFGREWGAGVAMTQLRAPAYRESRLGAAVERKRNGQRLGLTGSILNVTAGEPPVHRRSGIDLDLAWGIDFGPLAFTARAPGALRTRGAQELGAPRGLGLSLRAEGPSLTAEFALDEGTAGRRIRLGVGLRPLGPLELGAAWSSAEPRIRLLVGIKQGRLALAAGWAWHSVLPPSQVVSLSHIARTRAVGLGRDR